MKDNEGRWQHADEVILMRGGGREREKKKGLLLPRIIRWQGVIAFAGSVQPVA